VASLGSKVQLCLSGRPLDAFELDCVAFGVHNPFYTVNRFARVRCGKGWDQSRLEIGHLLGNQYPWKRLQNQAVFFVKYQETLLVMNFVFARVSILVMAGLSRSEVG
jgi:hypothetical protein